MALAGFETLVDGLGGGLYEVRAKVPNLQYRVLFCIKGSAMVLLHGFMKSAGPRRRRSRLAARDRKNWRRNKS